MAHIGGAAFGILTARLFEQHVSRGTEVGVGGVRMFEVKRVLCPVDLTELSIRPLAYAGAIGSWYRGELTALHVVPTFEPMEVRAGALFDPVQFVYPVPRERVRERLRQAVHTAGVAIDHVDVVSEAGDPAAIIVDQASTQRADLVVMATHGRSGFDRRLLGSVTRASSGAAKPRSSPGARTGRSCESRQNTGPT